MKSVYSIWLKGVEVKEGSCLRRFKQLRCEKCVRACSAGAISPLLEGVKIDQEKCSFCGLCYSACPSEAIKPSFLPYSLKSESDFIYFCSRSLKEDFSSCLGWLDVGEILLPFSQGAKRVILSPADCSECTPGVIEALERRVKLGKELLRHFSKEKEIGLEPFFLTSLSRRESLSFLRERTLKAAEAELNTFLSDDVQIKRRNLVLALRGMGNLKKEEVKSTFALWAELHVEAEKCDLCEVCSRLCPSKALFLLQDGDRVLLAQKPSRCLKCSLCVKVCPQRALKFEKENDLKLFVGEREKFLVKGVYKECLNCGVSFLGKPEESKCLNCRKLEDFKSEVKRILGGERIVTLKN